MKNNDTPLNANKRASLKRLTAHGDIDTIAGVAGTSRKTVERWFLNESNNMVVQQTVINLLEQRSTQITKSISEIIAEDKSFEFKKQGSI